MLSEMESERAPERALLVAAAALLTLSALRPASAQGTSPIQAASSSACRDGEPARRQADEAIAAYARALAAASDGDDLAELRSLAMAVRQSPCLEDAQNLSAPLVPSVAAARLWWASGGERWLRTLGRTGDVRLFPPTTRWLLPDRQARDTGPLRPFLCPGADLECQHRLDEWRERAEPAIAARWADRERITTEDVELDSARRAALATEPRASYATWLSRAEAGLDVEPLFALGGLRPLRGWLVLFRGFAGHGHVWAFELETGSTYAWSVQPRRDERGRDRGLGGSWFRAGVIPPSELEDAALFFALAEQLREGRAVVRELRRPAGVGEADLIRHQDAGSTFSWVSMQDGVPAGWGLFTAGQRVLRGELDQGNLAAMASTTVGEERLRRLLGAMAPRCPPRALPQGLLAPPKLGQGFGTIGYRPSRRANAHATRLRRYAETLSRCRPLPQAAREPQPAASR